MPKTPAAVAEVRSLPADSEIRLKLMLLILDLPKKTRRKGDLDVAEIVVEQYMEGWEKHDKRAYRQKLTDLSRNILVKLRAEAMPVARFN